MQQLVLTNIPMDLSNFYNSHLIHCLPKVGQHALYMLNSMLPLYFPGESASTKFTE